MVTCDSARAKNRRAACASARETADTGGRMCQRNAPARRLQRVPRALPRAASVPPSAGGGADA
jgi:hypothetical protein